MGASYPENVIGLPLVPENRWTTAADGADVSAGGKLSAFEDLFHSHASRMKSLAYNLLGNTADAEDAVQEAFLKACRGMDRFERQSSVSTWIYRILVNTCYDAGRSRQRRSEAPVKAESPRPGADVGLRVALERAIAALDERQRTVFLLSAVEGFRHAEIAAILEIPETTSRSVLFEAKKALRNLLSQR